jgi:hypothetical protein
MCTHNVGIVLALVFVLLPLILFAEETELHNDTSAIISEMKQLFEKEESLKSGGKSQAWKRIYELRNQLVKQGEKVVPIIASKIDSETDIKLREQLTYVLGDISSERAIRKLINLYCFDVDVADSARWYFFDRARENWSFSFQVSDAETQKIIEKMNVEYKDAMDGCPQILALCAKNPIEPRFHAILNRFVRELKEPSEMYFTHGTITSPRALSLRQFLVAFKCMGPEIRPYLREAIEKASEQNNDEVVKWLHMGLGMTGDSEVIPYLKDMLHNEPEPYTRGEAIAPYVMAAGKEAIPLLRELLDDKANNEFVSSQPSYFIAGCAREHLIKLTEDDFENSPFITELNAILDSHNINKDDLEDTALQQLREELPEHGIGSYDKFEITKNIDAAFWNGDLEYINKYIENRRKADEQDIVALLLDYFLNISYYKFQDALDNIRVMLKINNSDLNECKKCNAAVIWGMTWTFEHYCLDYFINPDKANKENIRPQIGYKQILYLLELNNCL